MAQEGPKLAGNTFIMVTNKVTIATLEVCDKGGEPGVVRGDCTLKVTLELMPGTGVWLVFRKKHMLQV